MQELSSQQEAHFQKIRELNSDKVKYALALSGHYFHLSLSEIDGATDRIESENLQFSREIASLQEEVEALRENGKNHAREGDMHRPSLSWIL